MITEISVFLPNIAGQFNHTLEIISKLNLNILAFTIDQAGPYSVIRLVCQDPERVYSLLKKKAFVVDKNKIFALKMIHKPGQLKSVTEALAKAGVNIEYGYLTVTSDTDQAIVLLKTNDQENAKKAITEVGIEDLDSIPGDLSE